MNIELIPEGTYLQKETKTKFILVGIIILVLFGVGLFVGYNSGIKKEKEGYIYVPSAYVDSLENASNERTLRLDSIELGLKSQRDSIDNSTFTSDDDFNEIIKNKADGLYNKTPSYIDSLFIDQYDSAVAARRFLYNN